MSNLKEENEALRAEIEALKASIPSAPAPVKMITMDWKHDVDLSHGQEPSAYGILLVADENGDYTGSMTEERAVVELTRKGKAFAPIQEG